MNTTQAPIDPTSGMTDPAEFIAAQRKQEMALALLKQLQGGAPEPEKTRILARKPISNVLMNAMSQSLVRDKVASADKRIGDLTKAQQDAYSAGVSELMGASDKNAAIAKALASNNPQLRALAQAQDKARREAEEKAAQRKAELAKEAARLHGDKGDTAGGLRVLGTQEINPEAQIPPAPAPKLEARVIDGKTIPFTTNIDPKTGKQTGTAGSMGTSVTVTNDLREKEGAAFAKAAGTATVPLLEKNSEGIQRSVSAQQAADRILRLAQDPQVLTGFAAEPRNFLASAGAFLGFSGPEAPAKTQVLLSNIAEQTLDASLDLKGAITEREWPRLAQARAGEISYTPQALQELAHITRAKEHNKMVLALQQRNKLRQHSEEANRFAEVLPIPQIQELDFPPELYDRGPNSTVIYKGSIDALLGKKAASPSPSQGATPYSDLSDEALRQRLEALRRR